ncbi:Membrane protein insertase MisCB precursor [Corynebacterium kalinowskii]|uniref:Membrane protein insertase YidC n=1 Tax=Corynebacterium kalinowskii TaxID=2675216 RepID=A0A6B8VJD4_9CORY|nr:membrane protein insertase YidC [Corynebacterium kalinowskii]QGU03159.1 Membrane protein insertase MisCB precursor [Corynebacterium kalinowskii]
MIEFMIYPVSAIMKFWHYLLASVFGVDPSLAWLLSIFGLVFTVRSIIAPLTWMQMKSGRKGQLIQPKLKALQKEFESRTDADAFKWLQSQRKELHKEHSYSPLAGCAPAFIQFPVFIGLYQVLLRMARPAEGLDAAHHPIGFLSPTDVAEFLQVKFLDVPLPAYIAMTPERLAELGTTKEMAIGVITPLVLAACVFTIINMAFSTWRGYRTLDWHSSFAVGLTRFLASFVVLVPILLLVSAFTAPLPLAIMLYWFGGNLWSMGQFFVFTWHLERTQPLTEEFIAMREESKADFKVKQKALKAHKRAVRKHRALMLLQPHKFSTHRQTIAEAKARRREERRELTKDKRENAKLRREAEKQQRAEKRAAKQAEKEQAEKDQME